MALCTAADLYQWSSGVCIDGRADLVIEDVSSRVEAYCGRKFGQVTATEKLQGNGSLFLLPSRWPITAISACSIDGDAITLADISIEQYEGDDARAIYYANGWPRPMLVANDLTSDLLRSEERNISLTYTAGYSVVPASVKMVVIQESIYQLAVPLTGGLIRERTPGGWDQTFDRSDASMGLSARSRVTLDAWRAKWYA